MQEIIDHYAKLSNKYASRAGQLYGLLEILPALAQGLSEKDVHGIIKMVSDRAKEIMQ
jgi:hypothetical protein